MLILGGVVALVGVAALFYPSIRVVERISSGSTEDPEPMPPAPFRFLNGNEPVIVERLEEESMGRGNVPPGSIRMYSFEANYEELIATAGQELKPLGFHGASDTSGIYFFTRDDGAYNEAVQIIQDSWQPKSGPSQHQPGWQTVTIKLNDVSQGGRPGKPIERFSGARVGSSKPPKRTGR